MRPDDRISAELLGQRRRRPRRRYSSCFRPRNSRKRVRHSADKEVEQCVRHDASTVGAYQARCAEAANRVVRLAEADSNALTKRNESLRRPLSKLKGYGNVSWPKGWLLSHSRGFHVS